MNPEEVYKQIIGKLTKLRKKEIFSIVTEKFILFLCFSFIGVYIATLSESVFRFNTYERKVVFVLLLFMVISSLIVFLTKPLKIIFGIDRSLSDERLAEKVGFKFGEIRDRLLNAIQIYFNKQINREHYSEELIDNYVKRIGKEILNKDFNEAGNFRHVLDKLKIFGIILSAGILMFGFFHGIFGDS